MWVFRVGAWTRTVAVVNDALALAGGIPMIRLLVTDRFLHPEFTALDRDWITNGTIGAVVVVTLRDIVDVTVRAERQRRGMPAPVAGSGNTFSV